MSEPKTEPADSLPPTLCEMCKHGTVIQEAATAYTEDDGDFWLEARRAHRREISFCRNPLIAGRGEAPLEMEHVVLRCGGFVQRELRVTKTCPEKAALRRSRAQGRRRRRGS
jgi:hypothetical protein